VAHYLGIDTSTTATKALVMDPDGAVVAVGRSDHDVDTPHPLWSEQAPALWWDATIMAIRAALAEAGLSGSQVGAVGLTGQMHGLVLLDDGGQVLRPSILWNDQRTQAECDEIRSLVGRAELIATTGNDALTGFTAPKILWVRADEPEVFDRVRHVLLPKDYVRYRLTGGYAADKADGSGTLLFDLEQRDWSPHVLDRLGIPREWLPPTHERTGRSSTSAIICTQTGLRAPPSASRTSSIASSSGISSTRSGRSRRPRTARRCWPPPARARSGACRRPRTRSSRSGR
jgi:xylulokinase